MKKGVDILPRSLAPRLVGRESAAAFVDLSPTKFDELVKEGRAPRPKRIDTRKVWDVRDLERFADDLPYDGPADEDKSWDN